MSPMDTMEVPGRRGLVPRTLRRTATLASAVPEEILGREEEPAALDALPGRLAKEAGAAALILGESGLVGTTLAGEAMIRSR